MPIEGPFFFAWVEPDETTFGPEHHVMDEYIFSVVRTLAEGEKPLLEIEIQNPHVGILNPSRKYWAWFAWDNGEEIVPLFFGRVVGSPVEIFEEVIRLQLVADPIDYKARLQTVAATLKTLPYYDPIFIDIGYRDDPNAVLEGYAMVWDVDPVTHAVTANHIITGDSNEDFTGDDHFYDGMQMTIGQPPATAISMDASVQWTQTGQGIIEIGNYKFSCLNGDGIIADWPKVGADIGGGYRVASSHASDSAGAEAAEIVSVSTSWQNKDKEHSDGDALSMSQTVSVPMGGKIWAEKQLTFEYQPGFLDPFTVDSNGDPAPTNIPMSYRDTIGYVMAWNVTASLSLQYGAARKRTERITFTVRADTQAVLTSPELSEETETMTRSGSDVGLPLEDSGPIPIGGVPGEVPAPTYFATDRGRQSLEYLAAVVRARLLYRCRCIEIQFDCDYTRGSSLTTRQTVTLHDPRIAGGVALGKITGAVLSVSDSGIANCQVTLAVCAGKGNAIAEVAGDPGYVAVGYVDDGYQQYDNSTIVLPDSSDLGYAPPVYVPGDDHLSFPLTREQIVLVDVTHQGADVAAKALDSMAKAANLPAAATTLEQLYANQQEAKKLMSANSLSALLKQSPTWHEFQFKPCDAGPFHKVYDVAFTDLTVPMGINLESETA